MLALVSTRNSVSFCSFSIEKINQNLYRFLSKNSLVSSPQNQSNRDFLRSKSSIMIVEMMSQKASLSSTSIENPYRNPSNSNVDIAPGNSISLCEFPQ